MTTVEKPEIGTPTEVPAASPRPRRLRRSARTAAALCIIAVLGGVGFQSWLLYCHHRSGIAAHEALDAATKYAEILTTANPGTIDQQIGEILDGSTGGFHDRYAKQSSDLRALLLANQVTTTGTVVDSAVKSADANNATVLLFVEQTFTSATLKDVPAGRPAQPDVTAMAITLAKVAGHWLVSDVAAGQQQK
jgi:Mce-associated membrane protein